IRIAIAATEAPTLTAPVAAPALATATGVMQTAHAAVAVSSSSGPPGSYEGPKRLARGNLGEKLATDALAKDGHTILDYKPDIAGTNQGGIDIVTMKERSGLLGRQQGVDAIRE